MHEPIQITRYNCVLQKFTLLTIFTIYIQVVRFTFADQFIQYNAQTPPINGNCMTVVIFEHLQKKSNIL